MYVMLCLSAKGVLVPAIDLLADGSKSILIPAYRLKTIRDELRVFAQSADLNGFQHRIIASQYSLDIPDPGFEVRSVVLLAVPHPLCAIVRLVFSNTVYQCYGLVPSDFKAAERSLKERLGNWNMAEAQNVPLKRLSVQSGFTTYGRNNVTYINGFGSCFSLAAYLSDTPCDDCQWQDPRVAPQCSTCSICAKLCPTGAIRKDRFLVDNERCLSYLNEGDQPFPPWLDPSVHHTLYDCLLCQMKCPMNRSYAKKGTENTVEFSELEVQVLLAGRSPQDFSESLLKKVAYLGLDQWPGAIAKNVRAILTRPRNSLLEGRA